MFEVHAPGAKQGVWSRTIPMRLKGPWMFLAVDRLCSSSKFLTVLDSAASLVAGRGAVRAAAAVWGGRARSAVSFAHDVQPIFDDKCTACHPVAYPYLDLRRGHSYDELVGVSPPNAPS